MKKSYLSFIMLLICNYTFSQSNRQVYKNQAAVDTAGIEFASDQLKTYVTQKKFPVFGSNEFGHRGFAQVYEYFGAGMDVEQILIRFYSKESLPDRMDSVDVNVYGVITQKLLPDSNAVLGSQKLAWAEIDTAQGKLTVVKLTSPIHVTKTFAVGVDLTSMLNYTDHSWYSSVGIASTDKDEPNASDKARAMILNGRWKNLAYLWPQIDGANLIILPVVNEPYALGIEEATMIDGIQMSAVYPNPAKDEAKIQYLLAEAGEVSIDIIDASGKIVESFREGKQNQGKHERVVNVAGWAPGIYFYSLTAGEKTQTKKMLIQ